MAHDPQVRATLKAAYMGGLGLEVAADKAGVPYGTARNWQREAKVAGDDWDKFRNANLLMAGGGMEQAIGRVVAAVILEAESAIEHLKNTENLDPLSRTQAIASLTDSLNKAANVARKGMPEADQLAIENNAVKALADLFIRLHPKSAEFMLSTVEAWAHGTR
jgi:hypothetical protein